MRYLLIAALLILVSGCASRPQGRLCNGDVASLEGKNLGKTTAWIFDQVTHFTITKQSVRIDSGQLSTSNSLLYLASSVTPQGYYAQRLGNNRFRLINAPQNLMITWTCPAPGSE